MAQNQSTANSSLKRDAKSGGKESRGVNQKLRERAVKERNRKREMLSKAGKRPREREATKGKDKFLLIEVPNFNNAEAEADSMSSYLRLGSVPEPALAGNWEAPKSSGEDLASIVDAFLDDERVRDDCPGFVPVEDRVEETWDLHTKGGWRDHSDGNRISTTRGDKVEVIRGSYKLLVLGRQDDAAGAIGWDVSGGHIEGGGMKSCIDWVQTFDGTWRVIETSEKGDTITTQHGNSINHSFGEIQESTTGSPDEMRPSKNREDEPIKIPAPNPVITNRTWARRIDSYTGSSDCRVPVISDETWVDRMVTKTHMGSMTDDTTVDGHMSTTTTAETMLDTTIVTQRTSITLGSSADVTVGNMMSVTVGAVEDVTLGALIEMTLGVMLEMNVSGSLSVNLGKREEIDLSNKLNLTPSKTEAAGTITRTSATEISTTGIYKVSAKMIQLG